MLALNAGVDVASAAPPIVETMSAAPPIVETTGTPIRTTTTAQLAGRVDPRGAATSYFFEYGDQGPCGANPCTTTTAEPVGAGDLTVLVAAEVSGLDANTTYHYRLIADNGDPAGPSFGTDMTVTTRASEAPLSHGPFPGPPGSDRAWEQVSLPDSGGNPVADGFGFSADGERAFYFIAGGGPLSETGSLFSPFAAERSEAGWQPRTILPSRSTQPGSPHWKLVPDSSLSTIAAATIRVGTEEFELWRLTGNEPPTMIFRGSTLDYEDHAISDDGSRLLASLNGPVDPARPVSGLNLYELTLNGPRLVSLLPDGSVPACGIVRDDSFFARWSHGVAADGSVAFFASKGDNCFGPARIYLRDLDAAATELVSPPPVSGPECDAVFLSSTPGAVFFWSKSRLAAEDSEPGPCVDDELDKDIYRYDLENGGLRCVTCVRGGVDVDLYRDIGLGPMSEHVVVAEDGSRVYFESLHALLPEAPEVTASGNVYRVDVSTGDLAWVGGPGLTLQRATTAATADGAVLLLRSNAPFPNPINGSSNGGTTQYYRYDDRDRSLTCVSCPEDGSPARGEIGLGVNTAFRGATPMSDDGDDVVFATPTPLVPLDQNTPGPGVAAERGRDVYEWRDGRQLLVTDGLTNTTPGTEGPVAVAVSGDGRDLYFVAPAQYTPDALDGYRRLYDARIGGGFTYPTPPLPCPLEVCQGTPRGTPEEATPGTSTFNGPGNRKPRKRVRKTRHRKQAAGKHGRRAGHRRGSAR